MIRISDVKPIGGGGAAKHPVKSEVNKPDNRVGFKDAPEAVRYIISLIHDAIKSQASAIHIEPHGKEIVVRYRIDGVLRPGQPAPHIEIAHLANRVKNLANLDIEENRLPQDGRFDIAVKEKQYVINAALMPVADGEKIVLHIVDRATVPHDLEKLGYWGQNRQHILDAIQRASGLVAVVGPAGSGKTSTLYSMARLAHDPSHSVITIEDSIEYRIPGISQTLVDLKVGMTYAGVMRAVLRQDPNVIMLADLQEPEITNLALHAARGGKLILAGAPGANIADGLEHIIAMRSEPYLVAAASRVIINQRLVRRLCPDCKQAYVPEPEEFSSTCKALGLKASEAVAHISGLQKEAETELEIEPAEKTIEAGKVVKLWRPKDGGCDTCGGTGFKGRIIIAEVLKVSPNLQKMIFSNVASESLYNQAIAEGMLPLPLDGLIKVCLGITSIAEVVSVLAEY